MTERRRSHPQIQDRETTKTIREIKVEAQAHPDPELLDHILVEDVIAFAKALEDADAPRLEGVRIVLARNDSGVARTMLVSWQARTDLVNGEPAPQVVEREQS